MDSIKRDVYVLKDTLKIPIEVTKGTNAVGFEFTVRDYDVPVTAMAVAYAYNTKMTKPNSSLCDVSENTITFTPEDGFFVVGTNELQVRIISEGKKIISFKEKVKCSDSLNFPDDEEKGQDTLVEQILAFVGKEAGERKSADEEEQKARIEADETEEEERKKEIKTERERIDELIKNNQTIEKEIKEARTGADGTPYESIGKSISGQIEKSKEEIDTFVKESKVLWSGSVLLQSSQTVELSEPISEQKNGIILLFSDYNSGGSGTQGYWDCFIPKQAIADFDGRFWSCSNQRWSASNATACNVMKCFYVSDTKITGHDYSISNGDGVYGMGSVLCRVYGV